MCAGLALFANAAVATPAPTRTALGAEAGQPQAIGAALSTVAIPAENYRLSLANGRVWLSWQPTATDCLRRGVGRVGLSLGPAERYDCTGFENVQGDPGARLQFYFDGGYQLRAVITEPSGKTTNGPVLTALQLWDWAAGPPTFGGGYIWAYYLGAKPGPQLFQISATTGRLVRRIALSAGTEPFLAYNDYGLWVAESGWGGPGCTAACPLWHVPPGADRASVALRAGVADQWFEASGTSVFADVLTRLPALAGYHQAIWRLDGNSAHVTYKAPATLLPAPDFAIGTGYTAVGNAWAGLYTLSSVSQAGTPSEVGECSPGAPLRVVRLSPATGGQSVIAVLPRGVVPQSCSNDYLVEHQAVIVGNAMYLLEGPESSFGGPYSYLVRVGLQAPGIPQLADPARGGHGAAPFVGLAGLLSPSEGWGANGADLYLTTDAGSTWRTITPGNIKGEDPIARIEEFVAFGPSHFWLVISDVPGNLCQGGSCRFGAVGYSADAGRHWAVSYLPGCFDCEVAASFVGTERGFVLGQFGASAAIYGTSDGGLSWDRLGEVHGVPGTTWTGLVFTSSSDGWLVGQGSGPSSSLVYATTDGGLSWARVPLPALVPGAQALGTGPLQFFGHDAVLPRVLEDAATGQDQAELDLSADGGAKWSQLTAPPWAHRPLARSSTRTGTSPSERGRRLLGT